ncbi:MAG: hypothetical protein ACQERD_04790 [Campylobacterota bacterium]
MRKLTTIVFILFISLVFAGCSTKSQDDVLASSKDDVSGLINDLMKKEKKINELSKKLEECKDDKRK